MGRMKREKRAVVEQKSGWAPKKKTAGERFTV